MVRDVLVRTPSPPNREAAMNADRAYPDLAEFL
jgi:hypothetical protein